MTKAFRLSRIAILITLALSGWPPPTHGAQVPARPEALQFPPLEYQPPTPGDYRHPLKAGPVAYVVPDSELPLINIVVFVHTGQYVEPAGKQGLSTLAGYLLARGGTARMTAQELEERLAFLAANLNSGVDETQGTVSLNLLSKDLDEGLALLRDVLATPRFQEDRVTLARQQMLQAMRQRNDDSSSIEEREMGFLAYGEEFWANRYPTLATMTNISRSDLEAFHRDWFHPSNYVVAVSGDFDTASMLPKLERLFADWPAPSRTPPAIGTNVTFAAPGAYIVNKEVNQGRVGLLLPGIRRDNPDYFPVLLMNEILGGGGFTSRIVNRVRSDEGLAYSAGTSFPGGVYYRSTFHAGLQTKSRTVPYAASLVLDEVQRMTREPVSDEELNTAKRSFIDVFPRMFATKAATASLFANEEFTGRYFTAPEFYEQYRSRFEAITAADVQRVAAKYLNLEQLVILVVGEKEQVLRGHPDHPVQLKDLVGGKITALPLRDPLTMQPIE